MPAHACLHMRLDEESATYLRARKCAGNTDQACRLERARMLPPMPMPYVMTRLLLTLGLLAVALPLKAQPASDTLVLSLPETVQKALTVSPEIGERQAQRNYDRARLAQARASRYLTEFTLTTGHSVAPGLQIPPGNTRPPGALYLNPNVENDWSLGALRPYNQVEVVALQPLWTWGQLTNTIEAAGFAVDVATAEVRAKALEVTLRTATLYYDLLLARALQRVAEEAGGIVERALEEVQRLMDEGAAGVDVADLYQTRITKQEYLRRVVEVEQRLQTARAALHRQLFLPEDLVLRPEGVLLESVVYVLQPLDVYEALALAHRPNIQQASAGLRARHAQVEAARADFYPKLFLRASARYKYAHGRPEQENIYVDESFVGSGLRVGIGFRQNLNFLQTEAKVDQAIARRSEVESLQRAARQLVLFQVEDAYAGVEIARAALASQKRALQLSKEWLRTEQINFDLGLGETEDLVKAVRANLDLQVRFYRAVRDYNVAVLELLHASGVLTQRIDSGTFVD